MSNRQGFSLAELIVGMVVASLVSAAMVQLMVVQSQFMSTQEGRSNARAVARSATGLITSDLRMVQTSAGVVAASASSITLRLPLRTGLICADAGGGTDVLFQPVDSAAIQAIASNLAGYGWRNSSGALTWVEAGISTPSSGTTGSCGGTDPLDTTIPGFEVKRVQPPVAGGFRGAPVFLHQQITYAFAASTSVPGAIGLFRTRVTENVTEELAAPFDATSRFNFYVDGNSTADATAPADLSDLRGIELVLVGVNERAGNVDDAERAPLRTAVFFKN